MVLLLNSTVYPAWLLHHTSQSAAVRVRADAGSVGLHLVVARQFVFVIVVLCVSSWRIRHS